MKELFSREYTARHLLNPQRKYVNEVSTDVAATFARIRAEMAAAKPAKVAHIKGSKR